MLRFCLMLIAAQAPVTTPPVRGHHALAYDETAKRVLLTGGSTPLNGGQSFQFFNDLWAWDGRTWTALTPSGDQMSGMRLAWDARRGRLLSFGAFRGNNSSSGDLRVLENGAWRTLGQHADMAGVEGGFVYDRQRDRFVAFGGLAERGQANGDTWEWAGETWTRVPGDGPPPRQAHAMAYDERRGRVVVFGGSGGGGGPGQRPPRLGDTWEFDGRTWTRRDTTGPSPRLGAGVTYDSRRGLVILFGGVGGEGVLGDMWSWDGTSWRKLSESGPEPRIMGYLAYDRDRDRVVLFGGRKGWPNDLNDTWEWDGSIWRRAPD